MGHYVPENLIRVAIAAWPWGAYLGEEGLKNGIRAKVSSFTRHHVNVSLTRAKISGYYVNSIMAKREVKAGGYDEAILLDPEGYVSEGTGENIFLVRNGIVKTTPLTSILEVDDRTVGTGKPGPVTRDLQSAFFDIVLGRDAKHASWLSPL